MTFDWPDGPDLAPINGAFRLMPVSQSSVSPYTGGLKSVNLANIWVARLEIDLKTLAIANDFQGFIESLEGSTYAVRMFDRWRPFPSALVGTKTGFSDGTYFTDGTGFTDGWSPAVVTAAARGERRLHLSGLPESQECFRRGDLFGVGGYLYEVKSGVTSNAAGEALVNFLPGLRTAVAASDPVTLWRPRLPMRLANGGDLEIVRINKTPGRIELSFIEDIP